MAAIALVAVAAALRLYGLGSGLWYDEIVTLVESARPPLASIVTDFPGVNAHPLYSVLAHGSITAFGESSWALRLPAALFGIGSVWAAFTLGRRLTSPAEAWAGALLLAVSYHHIWFSQNARGYTMMGFFALGSTISLLRAAESGRRRDYVLYALACAAGVYTHLTMAFVVAGHAVVILGGRIVGWRPALGHPWKAVTLSWIGAAAVAGALYAPFLPGLAAHFGAARPVTAANVATGGWAISEALRSVLSGAGVPAALAGGLVAAIGTWSLWRRAPLGTALLVMPAVVTVAAIVALGQPMRPRFFFFLSGAAAVFAGRGFGALAGAFARRRGSGGAPASTAAIIAGALVLAAASGAALARNYQIPKQDFDGAVRHLEGEEAAGARVAAAGPACFPIARYFNKTAWPCLETAADLASFATAPGRAIVVYTLGDYIDDPELRRQLPATCREVRRLPGTLGGGDMVLCDPSGREAR